MTEFNSTNDGTIVTDVNTKAAISSTAADEIVYRVTTGREKNTYWVMNSGEAEEVTYLYNQISALTNRENSLNTARLSGVQKFDKSKTKANGMPLTELTLVPAFDPSSLFTNNKNNILFNEIRENVKPPQDMVSRTNECSLFFDYNPFIGNTTIYTYNLITENNIPELKTIQSIVAGSVSVQIDPITNIFYGFQYKIFQLDPTMTKSPVFSINTTANFNLEVSYFINDKQIGKTQIIEDSSKNNKVSIDYQSSLPAEDSYIIFKPFRKDNNTQGSFTVSYDGTNMNTFTVS